MSLFPSMPSELVDSVVQNLAYPLEVFHREVDFDYKLSEGAFMPLSESKAPGRAHKLPSSPGLLSLSQANRQLRRLCLPLLFTYVYIEDSNDAEKVMQGSAKVLFTRYAKTLILGGHAYDYSETTLPIFRDFLENLSCVDLRCDSQINRSLCNTIDKHKSIPVIYIDSQNESYAFSDLSKVILRCFKLWDSYDLKSHVLDGLAQRISHLHLQNPMLLEEEGLAVPTFSGLHELTVIQHPFPCLSWLPTFASAHPHLKVIRFMSDYPYKNSDVELPFFPPFLKFLEDLRRSFCYRSLRIHQVAFSRTNANNADIFEQQWSLTAMQFYNIDNIYEDLYPSVEVLTYVGFFFPQINTLGLHFRPTRWREYHISEWINALKSLPLQRLDLTCIYYLLKGDNPWQSILQASQHEILLCSTVVEAGMFWYTTLIAQHIPSLRTIRITDLEGERGFSLYHRDLVVRDIPEGGREVIGDWKLSYDHQKLSSLAFKDDPMFHLDTEG